MSQQQSKADRWIFSAGLIALLALAAVIRTPLILSAVESINSDISLIGLMGRHIAAGQHFPLYLYGIGYLSSLEAYAAALAFLIWPSSPAILGLSAMVLFLVFALLTALLIRSQSNWLAALGGLAIIAVATPTLVQHFTYPLGGYVIVLILGVLYQLIWLRLSREPEETAAPPRAWPFIGTAVVFGLGLWCFNFFWFFALPCLLVSCLVTVGRLRQAWAAGPLLMRRRWLRRAGLIVGLVGLIYLGFALFVALSGTEIDWRQGETTLLRTWPASAGGPDLLRAVALLAVAGAAILWQRLGWGGLRQAFGRAGRHAALLAAAAGGVVLARLIHLAYTLTPEYGWGHVLHPTHLSTFEQMGEHLALIRQTFIPLIFQLRGPGGMELAPWILFGLILAAIIWIGGQAIRSASRGDWAVWLKGNWLGFSAALSAAALLVSLVLSAAVSHPGHTRYLTLMIAWWPILMVWLAGRLRRLFRPAGWALIGLLVLMLGWSTATWLGNPANWRSHPPQGRFTWVIEALDKEKVNQVYGDYWTIYDLAFISREGVAVLPGEEFAERANRYPPYAERFMGAERTAYLFREKLDDPALAKVRARLRAEGRESREIAGPDWLLVIAEP